MSSSLNKDIIINIIMKHGGKDNVVYEGHLESSGNSGISQSQKQGPVHLAYRSKGKYLFF